MTKLGNVLRLCTRLFLGEWASNGPKAYEREWFRRQREALRQARESEIAGQHQPVDTTPELHPNQPSDHAPGPLIAPDGSLPIMATNQFILFRDGSSAWCAATANFRDRAFGPIGRGDTRVDAILNLFEHPEFAEGVRQGRWPMPTLDEFAEVPKPEGGNSQEVAHGSDHSLHLTMAAFPHPHTLHDGAQSSAP